jgi:uncharacterized membrane protein
MKVEIKEVGIKSAFKTTLYLMSVPMGLFLLVSIIMIIVGAALQQREVLFIGIAYLIMPVFMLLFYGVISMLIALIYNGLSSKFGGLELTLKEKQGPIDEMHMEQSITEV